MKKAVVMLSGGLDSATVVAIARSQGFEVVALTFDYGQRHRGELKAAAQVAQSQQIRDHRWLRLDLSVIGGSALTDAIAVPKTAPTPGEIPVTYVPARNTIFLSLALGLAEVVGADDVFFGANAVDFSNYPDCRPAFVEAFQALANVATKAGLEGRGIQIHAPLMAMSKAEIIQTGVALGVDYGLTHSCYDPVTVDGQDRACGACEACTLRRRGFLQSGIADPTCYA